MEWLLLLLALLVASATTQAFVILRQPPILRPPSRRAQMMNDYVQTFLRNQTSYTIGVDLRNNHELSIELESVQRAILYHCPILVHSCIVPAALSLPLFTITVARDDDNENMVERIQKSVNETLQSISTGLSLSFAGLEIEGGRIHKENEVLYAVAAQNDDFDLLVQKLHETLLEQLPKDCNVIQFPNAKHQPQNSQETTLVHQPRVAFMQLPPNWDKLLQTENNSDTTFLTSDQGGNGIAPIFWIQYDADQFGGPQRLQKLTISKSSGSTLPLSTMDLPGSVTPSERYWETYHYERLRSMERSLTSKGNSNDDYVDKVLLQKTAARLETLYQQQAEVVPVSTTSETTTASSSTSDTDEETWEDIQYELLQPSQRPNAVPGVDEWTKNRIQAIVAARQRDLERKKAKPDFRENEIFAQYKRGELTPPTDSTVDEMVVFPDQLNRSHCVGFWKMIGSPTGFDVEADSDKSSDNLILRVDGTTASGPILNQETRQKASGGTWHVDNQTLRIRLVIPPEKDRILVMQGPLTTLRRSLPTMASNSFGIPQFERQQQQDDAITCAGTVWIEDAVTKANRQEIGSFSIMKLNTPSDPSQYTITIPRNVRNLD